ncbi:MAG TPA: choline ABC transporter ATP-binding protein [Steroidobacteraceae bacterium]|nr:choline ABC transporter ATP-binding protein [Steroidobacteraceae bacterium]
MNTALEFCDVDILFSAGTGRRAAALLQQALSALDAGGTRAQITQKFGVVVGMAGANLKVERGEISVLMGLSGSGKSTLLRAANGIAPVTRGRVLVNDGANIIDVAECDAATLRRVRRRCIAMVFQQFALLPWRSVRDNVGFGLEVRGDPAAKRRRIIDQQLELVGLAQWGDRAVAELSGGMQQRVGLARAFATDADILLMDEPFSALDPLIRRKLQDELLALQEHVKKTILFVSHDLDEALKLGDRISMLEGGRIVQTGTAEDIVLRPGNAYVAEFVQHMNPLNVLTGGMVMRRSTELVRDGGGIWLDDARRYRVAVNGASEPTAVSFDGEAQALGQVQEEAWQHVRTGVAIAPASMPLRVIIELRQRTGHPVLLVDAGCLCGVCDAAEIVRALAGRMDEADGAAGQADAAN